MRNSKTAFTLIELLVAIAIIGLLAALLLSSLSKAKERAHRIKCISNLRQIVLGSFAYVQENDDRYPAQPADGVPVLAGGGDGRNFYDLLMPQVKNPAVWICPGTRELPGKLMSYHMNGLIVTTNGLKASSIVAPSRTLLIGESGGTRWDQAYLRPDQIGAYLYDRPQLTHNGGGNVAFADGHVAWYHDMKWNSNYFTTRP